jgi:glycosyltransferase involved in cell wall biosynthesis
MRIGFFTHYTELYGANRSLLELMEGLRPHGVVPHVVAPDDGEVTEVLRALDVPVAVIPMEWCVSEDRVRRRRVRRLRRNLLRLPRVIQQLRAWKVDLVHTNTLVLPVGALAARCLSLPHVWHLREYGDLDYGFFPDWGWGLTSRCLGSARAVIAVSNSLRAHFLRVGRVPSWHVVYNAVGSEEDFARYRAQAGRKRTSTDYTFALVGLFHTSKGQGPALEALARVRRSHPHVRLILAGAGPDEGKLRAQVARLELDDAVEFVGYRRDPYEVWLTSDAALMCSHHEAMGRVTAEAMSACLPVIGHDSGGTTELIDHERTGLLYRNGVEDLATCMLRFVEQPTWARELGEQAWAAARIRFTREVCAEQTHEIFRRALHDGPGRGGSRA